MLLRRRNLPIAVTRGSDLSLWSRSHSRRASLALLEQPIQARLGVDDHRAKLQTIERPTVAPDAAVGEEDGTRLTQKDQKRHDQEQRRQENQRRERQDDVTQASQNGVEVATVATLSGCRETKRCCAHIRLHSRAPSGRSHPAHAAERAHSFPSRTTTNPRYVTPPPCTSRIRQRRPGPAAAEHPAGHAKRAVRSRIRIDHAHAHYPNRKPLPELFRKLPTHMPREGPKRLKPFSTKHQSAAVQHLSRGLWSRVRRPLLWHKIRRLANGIRQSCRPPRKGL
jgi:hypothetical protein